MMLAKGNTGCLSLLDSGKANVGNFIHFHSSTVTLPLL